MNRNKLLPDSDDTALVTQAIKELPYVTQSYEILMKRYYPLIYRTCFGILRDSSEAEEISQVILLKVFNGLPRFEARSTFKTWLITIINNTCFSRAKKLKKERELYCRYSDEIDENQNDQSSESQESLWSNNFETMISCLDTQEQLILNLRFVSELSLGEIATVMDMRLSATKMRFYRAIEKLKQEISPV